MGGSAFSKDPDPLHTPRMAPTVYEHMLRHCHAKLRELFIVVATPIEGPGKNDYGDIDIFVALNKKDHLGFNVSTGIPYPNSKDPFDAVKVLLGAERIKKEKASAAILAIPWPDHLIEGEDGNPAESEDTPSFIQVDVHICDTVKQVEWFLFKHAHGDLWNLLGSTIRPYGLTVDEVGLYIRIPEIEKLDKKKARVLLTSEPRQIVEFLGLSYNQSEWQRKFETGEQVFEYAASSRFFWVKPSIEGDEAVSDGDQQLGGDYQKRTLKSNDRQRISKRGLFRRWIEEFIPECREQGRFTDRLIDRDQTREDAFKQFGVRGTYEAQLFEFKKEQQRHTIFREVIKPAIPETVDLHRRNACASALKKIIMEDDTTFDVRPSKPLQRSDGMYDEDLVRTFVEHSWEDVARLAWQRNQELYVKKLAAK